MRPLALLASLVITSGGCCTMTPGSPQCESRAYAQGWTHKNPEWKAPCADELLVVADTLLPDPALRPLHGVVVWYPGPFMCTMTQKVWGCAPDIERDYVSVLTATGSHASDTALAEEVAHWIWLHYKPNVLTEEWRVIDGQTVYWRDPEFKAWFESVRDEARRTCVPFDQGVFK